MRVEALPVQAALVDQKVQKERLVAFWFLRLDGGGRRIDGSTLGRGGSARVVQGTLSSTPGQGQAQAKAEQRQNF